MKLKMPRPTLKKIILILLTCCLTLSLIYHPGKIGKARSAWTFDLPGEFRFEDMLLNRMVTLKNLKRVSDLNLVEDDVVLASYPKSGTTVTQAIVWLIRHHRDMSDAGKISNLHRVPFMDSTENDAFALFDQLPHPRTMKTHLPYRFLPVDARRLKNKVIYVLRNPKDTLVSYFHLYRMKISYGKFPGTWDDFFSYFARNGYMLAYGNPLRHIRSYWTHRRDANLHLVFYEDIARNATHAVAKMAAFLNVTLNDNDLKYILHRTQFDAMKHDPYANMAFNKDFDQNISKFLRKGAVGDWKNYFNKDQSETIDKMYRDVFGDDGPKFTYDRD